MTCPTCSFEYATATHCGSCGWKPGENMVGHNLRNTPAKVVEAQTLPSLAERQQAEMLHDAEVAGYIEPAAHEDPVPAATPQPATPHTQTPHATPQPAPTQQNQPAAQAPVHLVGADEKADLGGGQSLPPGTPVDNTPRFVKHYPCGCSAGPGPSNLPGYCPNHGNAADTSGCIINQL